MDVNQIEQQAKAVAQSDKEQVRSAVQAAPVKHILISGGVGIVLGVLGALVLPLVL